MEVAVDLIGPWKYHNEETEIEYTFKAINCIDTVTNFVEIIRIRCKNSSHIAHKFSNCWLSRFPKPNYCIHDSGREFIGHEFQNLLTQAGIIKRQTTVKDPQSNEICERMHQTIADILRLLNATDPPTADEAADEMMDIAIATCLNATRCAVNHQMWASPGGLVFNRDMLLGIPLIADYKSIQGRRQKLIDKSIMVFN